jgi:hypothetical protein
MPNLASDLGVQGVALVPVDGNGHHYVQLYAIVYTGVKNGRSKSNLSASPA